MREFTLHSDGTPGPNGFVLVDGDGRKIEGAVSATVSFEPREVPRLSLELLTAGINIKVKLDTVWYSCINCSEILDHECPPESLGGS